MAKKLIAPLKTYVVEVTRRRFLEIYASSEQKAIQVATELYESGDACAELESAKYEVVFEREEE